MEVQASKWGNSLAVRIPKAVTERARLREGELLEISVKEDGMVVLRPARPSYRLEDLLVGVTDENLHSATDWGWLFGHEL